VVHDVQLFLSENFAILGVAAGVVGALAMGVALYGRRHEERTRARGDRAVTGSDSV